MSVNPSFSGPVNRFYGALCRVSGDPLTEKEINGNDPHHSWIVYSSLPLHRPDLDHSQTVLLSSRESRGVTVGADGA